MSPEESTADKKWLSETRGQFRDLERIYRKHQIEQAVLTQGYAMLLLGVVHIAALPRGANENRDRI